MKETIQKIIELCESTQDENGVLSEIRTKSKNKLIQIEWAEKHKVIIDDYARLAETDYYNIDSYQNISYFKDGYHCHKNHYGRSISWPEDNRQPVDEWIYNISFSTGAYIFGDDYEGQTRLFQDFFEELRTYKPDYEDLHNHSLYWKIENASVIKNKFKEILKKYHDKNKEEITERKIVILQAELAKLTI